MNFRFHFPFLLDPAGDATAGGNSSPGAGAPPDASQNPGGDGGAGAGAGAAPAAFDFRTLVTEKGEFVEGWQEKLPQDYDPYRKTLANFKDFGSFTKAFNDNMTAARAKNEGMLKLPGADAKPEDIAAFHKALGVPERPEDYGLKAPEKLPEGVAWDEGFATDFVKAAHDAGLTKQQVEKLASWHLQAESQRGQNFLTEGTKLYEAEMQKLQKTFGSDYEKRMVDVKRVALTLGLDEDHPAFWRADTVLAFAKMADMISEDKLVTSEQLQNKLGPDTAAKDIMTNPANPDYAVYNDPGHPRHKEVVAFVNEQMKKAYPDRRA
jgi:hypothetical protein